MRDERACEGEEVKEWVDVCEEVKGGEDEREEVKEGENEREEVRNGEGGVGLRPDSRSCPRIDARKGSSLVPCCCRS